MLATMKKKRHIDWMKCTYKGRIFFFHGDKGRNKDVDPFLKTTAAIMKITYPGLAIDFILVYVSAGCLDGLNVV